MKRIAIALILLCVLWSDAAIAQDITLADTLWLKKATHINYDVDAWDTVFVDIQRGSVQVERVFLSSNGKGRWNGFYVPSYDGNFVAEYNAVYSGDTIVEEQYFSVLDTAAFHGAAAGITAESVVDEFESRGYGFGSGAYACTVEVRDSSLTAGIQGVRVIVRNNAATATVRWSTTNADGLAFFGMDTLATGATYKLWLQELGYNFTFPEPLDLRGDTTAVYYGTAFDIGDPPADSTCAVFDQIFDPQLDSLSGVKICFWLVAPADSLIVYDGVIFSPYEVCTTTTVSGRWRLDLLPESLFHRPAGMVYWAAKITYPFSHGGIIVEYDSVSVPVATQVEADLILH